MNLKYETIKAAVSGDKKAMDEVLNEYEPYMMFLSIIVRRDKDGHEEKVFSQDAYQMLKLHKIKFSCELPLELKGQNIHLSI